jgi:tetratricopeptide (TPR) repeat protein
VHRKSQIAIEYAHRLHSSAPETSIFWIYASNKAHFKAGYTAIAIKLKLPGFDNPQVDQLELVREWLLSESSGSWLLILDNIDDASLMKKDGQDEETTQNDFNLLYFLPQRTGSAILVTSRYRLVAFDIVVLEESLLSIEIMETKEAVQILNNKLADCRGGLADRARLATALENIPLAITQAAAYLSKMQLMTIDKYLSKLESNETSLLLTPNSDLRRDQSVSNSVIRTWQISFKQIQEESPHAARLLSWMCMFDRQHIPGFLLRNNPDGIQLDFCLEILLGYSFIRKEAEETYFGMHRLVQLAAKEWLRLDGSLQQESETALKMLSATYPTGEYVTWGTCRALEPHAQALQNIQLNSDPGKLSRAKLQNGRAFCAMRQGEYAKAESMARESLDAYMKLLDTRHPEVLESTMTLGRALSDQGKYKEAEKMFRQVLEEREKSLGPEHPHTLSSLDSLADVLSRQGKYNEAEQMYRQVLEEREKSLRLEHPHTLSSLHALAVVLSQQGKYNEAEQMYRRALAGYEKVLGPEHPDTLTSVNNLALLLQNTIVWKDLDVLERQDSYDEIEQMYRRALAGREKVLGPEHPYTLTSVDNLALLLKNSIVWKDLDVLERQKLYDEIEQMHRRALAGREKVLGPEHPYTLTSVNNLALLLQNTIVWKDLDVLERQKLYDEIEQMYRRALAGKEKVLGPEHPDALTSVHNLAVFLEYSIARKDLNVLERQNSYDEIEQMHRRVLAGDEKALGLEHHYTKDSVHNLVGFLRSQGRNSEADELEDQKLIRHDDGSESRHHDSEDEDSQESLQDDDGVSDTSVDN